MITARRKLIAPLAVLVAAGAVTVASGATFTSQSANTASVVTAGTLTQSNSKNGQAIFDVANIKPGDTVNGTLTVTNTGSLPASFSLTEVSSTNGFAGSNLSLTITNTTTGAQVYTGTFGGLEDGLKNELGVVQPGVANTYRFQVRLSPDAPNADQGKSASAAYQWDSVQLEATTYDR